LAFKQQTARTLPLDIAEVALWAGQIALPKQALQLAAAIGRDLQQGVIVQSLLVLVGLPPDFALDPR
jgi:hypothetical protein